MEFHIAGDGFCVQRYFNGGKKFMSKIITVDLTTEQIQEKEYSFQAEKHYGRGLAMKLLMETVPDTCGRLDPENAIIYTPGLFTGNCAPSATRGTVMAKGDGRRGLAVSSITGDLPQKMASLDIASLVITGKSVEGNVVLYIDGEKTELLHIPELENMPIPDMVELLRSRFGTECALTGVGKAGDMMLPLASTFLSYPEGKPRFYCPRSGFGDVPGSKGLRAIVVKCAKSLNSPCANKEEFSKEGKALAKIILDNDICGGALPGLGSITLLHLLKSRQAVPPVDKNAKRHSAPTDGSKINYCCAPMCVIGCLNRHSAGTGEYFSAPEESEVRAAMTECFGESDFEFAKKVNQRGFELGLNTTEFVYTARMYWMASGKVYSKESLLRLLEEIAEGTVEGRLVGGGTPAIFSLYKDRADLKKLVTKPSVTQEGNFKVKLEKFYPELENMDDMELLYREVFLLENLGFCIFSSFATLNSKEVLELLARMLSHKLGRTVTPLEMLTYSGECIETETEYQRDRLAESVQKNIPEFIKVLYRYFEN